MSLIPSAENDSADPPEESTPRIVGRRGILSGAAVTMLAAACEVAPAPESTTTTTLRPRPPRTTTTRRPRPTTTTTAAPTTTTTVAPTTTTAPATTTTAAPTTTTTAAPSSTTTTLPDPGAPSQNLALKRLTYGRTPESAARFAALGWAAWLDEQLDPDSVDDSAVESMLSGYTTLTATNNENRHNGGQTVAELKHAAVLRAVHSDRQLHEVMVRFWSDHFNTDGNQWWSFLKADEERNVFRTHALGKFSDLLLGSAQSPAMLLYLNQAESHYTEGVNENWARELLELHSMGILDGLQPYTEDDMRTVANVVAGWGFDWDTYSYEWHTWAASPEPYSILDGAWSRPARPARDGEQDVLSLIDFLAHHPHTARHIAWKLCRHFVADEPPTALVDSAAQVFLDNDTAIEPVLRHIFGSEAFRTSENAKLRRPFELLMALMRSYDTQIGLQLGHGSNNIDRALGDMGHAVFGWTLPDGYPDVADRWISSQNSLLRWRLAIRCLNEGFHYNSTETAEQVNTDVDALLDQSVATAGELAETLCSRLLGYVPDPTVIATLLLAVEATPATAADTIRDEDRSAATLAAIVLCIPEFQYR